MISIANEDFWATYARLPVSVRQQARVAYRLFEQNPSHSSLHFKPVHPTRPIYSVRVSVDYRALGIRKGNVITWFWIGTHAEYERLLTRR